MLSTMVVLAACGGGGDDSPETAGSDAAARSAPADAGKSPSGGATSTAAVSGGGATLKDVLQLGGTTVETDDVALPGGADLPVGKPARIPFLLLDKGGAQRSVTGDRVMVYVAKDATSPAYGPFEVKLPLPTVRSAMSA